jgi:sugar phosphate isomerase/epimerase
LVEAQRLNDVGILATPLEFHTPKIPGRGQIDWPKFFARLKAAGYDGPVCIEVEDRDFEGSLDARKEALRQSGSFLRQCLNSLT